MAIAGKIEKFVNDCAYYDELPHSFDDTLIDKLIGLVDFDDEILKLVEKLIKEVDFENKSVPLQIVIRLLDTSLQTDAFHNNESLLEFVKSSELLLDQQRPARLIYDLFGLYSNPKVFSLQKVDGWLEVIRWCLDEIDERSTSIFVKKQISKFLCCLSGGDARRLMVLSGIVQTFNRKITDAQITNITTEILSFYVDHLIPEECISLSDCILESPRLGQNTLKLLVKLQKSHSALKTPFSPEKWKNESNRVDYVVFLLQDDQLSSEDASQFIELILVSPAIKIHHSVSILQLFSEKQVQEFVQNLANQISSKKIVNFKDFADLLPKLKSIVSLDQVCFLVSCLGERIMQTSLVFCALCEVFGKDIFETPEFAAYKHRLHKLMLDSFDRKEWEVLDTALEAAYLFPCFLPSRDVIEKVVENNMNSPYVLSTSLRILQYHFGGIPIELAESIIVNSPDPLPRLVAMKYMNDSDIFSRLSVQSICRMLYSCMKDVDGELRKEALKMAKLGVKNAEMKEEIKNVMEEWVHDRWIGVEIADLIGCSTNVADEGTMHLLEEMLTALKVHRNDDDTMDCY